MVSGLAGLRAAWDRLVDKKPHGRAILPEPPPAPPWPYRAAPTQSPAVTSFRTEGTRTAEGDSSAVLRPRSRWRMPVATSESARRRGASPGCAAARGLGGACGWLGEAPGDDLVQHSGNQRLIRHAFFECLDLDVAQIAGRQADIDAPILDGRGPRGRFDAGLSCSRFALWVAPVIGPTLFAPANGRGDNRMAIWSLVRNSVPVCKTLKS